MAELFEATRFDHLEMQNRFVRSATWEGQATTDGYPTPALTRTLVELARGGVGLIVAGHAYVSEEGQATPYQLSLSKDAHGKALLETTKAVHDAGGKIAAQIAHAGCMALSRLTGRRAVGPSAIEGRRPCDELSHDNLRRLTDAFARAAARAKEAGFDAVQVHAAHGYLIGQFLSPFYNKRRDEYGGPLENRARLLMEVLAAARAAVGEGFCLTVKINSEDFMDGGFTVENMLSVGADLDAKGLDAIEMSGGTVSSLPSPSRTAKERVEGEAYYAAAARRYKERIGAPLMLVGGIRSYEVAQKLVAEGTADYISLCRPLICEPDLINRWRSGDRRPSMCKSDNLCFRPGMKGEGTSCAVRAGKR